MSSLDGHVGQFGGEVTFKLVVVRKKDPGDGGYENKMLCHNVYL